MYNSIEITDSDDEVATSVDTAEPKGSETPPSKGESKENAVNDITPKKATPAYLVKDSSTSPSSSDKTGTSPSTGAVSKAQTTGRHRSRKSQHQTLRMSPTDLQFETISLGDDEARRAKLAKVLTDEQKLPGDMVSSIADFIAGGEMQALIKRISRERVRCNFLLATYQLPDMNFTLNTQTTMLRDEFRERLKQHNERSVENAMTPTRPTAAPQQATATANANASKVPTTNKGIVRARAPQS